MAPAWVTVIGLALAVSLRRAAVGIGWIVRGKRQRGWNLLYLAAAEHPAYYDRWVAEGEPAVVRRYCTERDASQASPRIVCVILGGNAEAARRSLQSVRRALGDSVAVWTDCVDLRGDGVTIIRAECSLNEVLAQLDAAGDWILPLWAGGETAPGLGQVLRHSHLDTASALVFWDDDLLVDGRRQQPRIKPNWDPILFRAYDGVTGSGLISGRAARDAAEALGATRFDEAGIAALVARMLTDGDVTPQHIPLVMTHRADRQESRAAAGRDAADIAEPQGLQPVSSRRWPSVSIVVPTRDRADLLQICLAGLRQLDYKGEVEVVIVDNDSVEPETHALLALLREELRATILPHPGDFNYSEMMNRAAEVAGGELLCMLNNDVEMLDGGWLTAMVRYALIDRVGAVGARLLYPDGTIQHAGIALGIGGAAGHVQKGVDPADTRFAEWHAYTRAVSALTGAVLVIARSKYHAVGGMDAEGFAVDFSDVDFCLRLQASGLVNVLVTEATLIHHESKSRATRRSPQSDARFARELALLRARWRTADCDDSYYSPLFRRSIERCILAF
jgi:GT2 family glycosyltransferase